jgi:hypothetical protein
MADFTVLARGDWGDEAVLAGYVASSFAPPAEIRALIEETWSASLARPGVTLFDGPLLRLEGFSASAAQVQLRLSRTSYKPFLGTNGRHAQRVHALGPHACANALGTTALVVTGDQQLVFGVRSRQVALYPGSAHPFGGCLEPLEPIDPAGQTRRELGEELGLAAADIRSLRLLAIGEDLELRQPELIYLCQTGLAVAELARRLDAQEHGRLWSIADDEAAIRAGLAPAAERTPLTRLALLTYGGWRLGEEWYRRHRPG